MSVAQRAGRAVGMTWRRREMCDKQGPEEPGQKYKTVTLRGTQYIWRSLSQRVGIAAETMGTWPTCGILSAAQVQSGTKKS